MSILMIFAIVILAMILVGAVLNKITWERAIILMIVCAIVVGAAYLIMGRAA